MSTCRVCNSYTPSQMVHYSVRHYAHLECALRKWGAEFFTRLGTWQLSRLAYKPIKDAGLLDAYERELKERPDYARTSGNLHPEVSDHE